MKKLYTIIVSDMHDQMDELYKFEIKANSESQAFDLAKQELLESVTFIRG